MRARNALSIFKRAFADWREDKAARLAAALAYYTAFAIAPLLVIAIGIAGLLFGQEAAEGEVVRELQGLVGRDAAEFVQEAVQSTAREDSGAVATILGVALLLFGASGVFGQLKDGLNTIWEVEPKPGRGLLGILKDRFASFTMVLGIGFLLLVTLILSAGLRALGDLLGGALPASPLLLSALHAVLSLGVITLLFAMIFRVLPDVEIQWRDVWLGAFATALLFTIGKFVLGLYLGSGSAGSAFGAAGGLVILLVWVYWSAQIVFFGAELTQVYANRYGSRIVPDEDAVAVTEEARAQQGMPSAERMGRGSDRPRAGGHIPAEGTAAPAGSAAAVGGAAGDFAPPGSSADPAFLASAPAVQGPLQKRWSFVGAGFMAALIAYATVRELVGDARPARGGAKSHVGSSVDIDSPSSTRHHRPHAAS